MPGFFFWRWVRAGFPHCLRPSPKPIFGGTTIEIALNISLHENQKLIQSHPALNKVVKAGKRFGKTKWLLYALLKAAGKKPKQKIFYTAPTYRQAKNIAWMELKWMLPKQAIARSVENELYLELINGSTLQLLGCDNEDSLRGIKIHGLGMDEAALHDRYVWDAILSGQLLGNKDEGSGFAYFISSPNKKGRNWFTDFHAEAESFMKAGNTDWAAFYYTIFDNPTLNPVEVMKQKSRTPDDTWQVEYMAIESEFAGQIYSEFHSTENVAECEYSPNYMLVRGIDWGINHPTACLWLLVDLANKMVYVTDEFQKSNFVIQESCEWIRKMTGEKPVEWTVIDPSTAKRNSQTGRTDKDEFQRWGIPCIPGDNRDRGYDITKMFLKKRMLKIHPKCKNLLWQIKNIQWGDKENDDEIDVLRYCILRIHDSMAGMNVFDENAQPPKFGSDEHFKMIDERRKMNFNNAYLFGEKQKKANSWLLEEAVG